LIGALLHFKSREIFCEFRAFRACSRGQKMFRGCYKERRGWHYEMSANSRGEAESRSGGEGEQVPKIGIIFLSPNIVGEFDRFIHRKPRFDNGDAKLW
jgi:hypothetical protein